MVQFSAAHVKGIAECMESGSRQPAVKIGVGIQHECARMHTPTHPPNNPSGYFYALETNMRNSTHFALNNALSDPDAYPILQYTLYPCIPRCIPCTFALPILDLANSPLGSLLLSSAPAACIHICIREIILAYLLLRCSCAYKFSIGKV